MEQDVIIGAVIDQSGSMMDVVPGTVAGFNHFVNEQKELAVGGEAFLSLTLFSSGFDVRYVAEPIENIPEMTASFGPNPYSPNGSTALLDAVAATIKGIELWVHKRDFKGRVQIMILTDGQENASREWHIRQPRVEGDDRDLLGLIEWKQKEGWEFVFLGAGGTEWLERTFGSVIVDTDHVFAYANDNASNTAAYAAASASVVGTRVLGSNFSMTPQAQTPGIFVTGSTGTTSSVSNYVSNVGSTSGTLTPAPEQPKSKKRKPKLP